MGFIYPSPLFLHKALCFWGSVMEYIDRQDFFDRFLSSKKLIEGSLIHFFIPDSYSSRTDFDRELTPQLDGWALEKLKGSRLSGTFTQTAPLTFWIVAGNSFEEIYTTFETALLECEISGVINRWYYAVALSHGQGVGTMLEAVRELEWRSRKVADLRGKYPSQHLMPFWI